MLNIRVDIDEKKQRELNFAADEFARDMRTYMECEEPYISSTPQGYPVAFKRSFYEDHEIEPHGILVPGPEDVLHACPAIIDRRSKYDSTQRTNNSIVDALLDGEEPSYCFDEIKFQVPREEIQTKPTLIYERELAELALREGSKLVLVNPAPQTVWALENYDFRIEVNPEWRYEYDHILEKTNKDKATVYGSFHKTVPQIRYYGTNGVPDKVQGRWAAFWPNPYLDNAPFPDYTFHFRDTEIEMHYMKGNRKVITTMPLQPKGIRYTPATTDRIFQVRGDDHFYFLETNVNFGNPIFETPNPISDSSVKYIQGPIPPFVNGVAENDTTVCDVEGGGTYHSRRPRILEKAKEKSKKPVAIEDWGDHPVGFRTEMLLPQELYRRGESVSTFHFRPGKVKEDEHTINVIAVSMDPTGRESPLPGLYWRTIWYNRNTKELNMPKGKLFICRGREQLVRYQVYVMRMFFGKQWEVTKVAKADERKAQHMVDTVNTILEKLPEVEFDGTEASFAKLAQFRAVMGMTTWSRVALYHTLQRSANVILPNKNGFLEIMSKTNLDAVQGVTYPPLDYRSILPIASMKDPEWRRWVSNFRASSYRAPATFPLADKFRVLRLLYALGFTPSHDEDDRTIYLWR